MIRFVRRILRPFRREDGTATIEFVLAVPVLIMMFTASFESGMVMTRSVMLERALDITMRELRLNHYPNPTHDQLKAEICNRTVVINDCLNVIKIELKIMSKATWTLPTTEPGCIDRAEEIHPPVSLDPGVDDDVMLVNVCVVIDPMFPTTGVGLHLPKDATGGFRLMARSAFVNEPT
ncbi:MAG: TadE/TadG family type IV pilus assembly protein [Paracoccaceae bacterium]|nr:TadE/TadG family type IV pilus assembly protein [Paracoccaceae bacterium]